VKFSGFIVILLFIFYSAVNAQPTYEDSLREHASLPMLLKKKALDEGFHLYFKEEWFQDLKLEDKYEHLSLENLLTIILPDLQLKVISFNPNYLILVKDLTKLDNIFSEAAPGELSSDLAYSFDPDKKYTISGVIRDNKNSESVIGANIFVDEIQTGTITNELGYFSLTLPSGYYHLSFTSVGYDPEQLIIPLLKDTLIDLTLYDKTTQLQEIIIRDEAEDYNISDLSIGTTRLNIETLKNLPPLMGEVDVIRSIMLLPGITTVGEGATGYNVRGGSVDQNLVLLDEAPVFNSSHFFGFFTAFNSLAIKDVTISKGGIPAIYGGRISSILDVKLRQGNKNKIHGEGGIGVISSNLLLEGPIIKDKTTFLLSGRITYSDWYLNLLPDTYLQNSNAYFHDLIGKITHNINSRNTLSVSVYNSHDKFKFPGDTTYGWSNNSATLKWAKLIKPKIFMINSLIMSRYDYTVWGTQKENEFQWKAGIDYYSLKSDISFNPNYKNKIDFGLQGIYYDVNLGDLIPDSEGSNINYVTLDPEKALEMAIYYNHEFNATPDLILSWGLRYSHFMQLGPASVKTYDPNLPRSLSSVIDQKNYDQGEIIVDYGGMEPRISMRYKFNQKTSIKSSFNRMRQYIHQISNTSAVSPVDIWKLSDTHIKPQVGDQISVGIFRNFKSNKYESSLEFYYKRIQNNIDYKDGANLLLNQHLETELLSGKVMAYGAELLLRKTQGRFNGWLAYTLSRTQRKVDGRYPEERVNNGNFYPVNYDKLHDLAIVGNYDFTRRYSFGFNFVLYSGRPISYPVGSYGISGFLIANFEIRNQERTPVYHRLDLSLSIKGNYKKNKKWHGSWVFSIYNVYARKNPYSIFFKARGFKIAQAYRLSVIGTAIPSVTYQFNF